ncbi:hypothetical protein PC41400_21685 [Paenibacillus chitinolyticus]|uniref:Uncharacterized protein n=1 Tax=Paenibacillus chitinolyticus TaxID=79263 RepID=A0A410X0D8_9BACL|nr:hypothetical protein [Paenibacillus chitinolyticus]MCY9593745.1 hypothetical protein [Paenibacillus chitinolyticus]MCY9599690.1 hypothetical protein [Paenibacillus chitinolyticus]QAV20134.1 hypothetical protein PC41400_21685 [Paenibacillus chitinolyticus]
MKKEEISELMYRLYIACDQAPYDTDVKELIQSAPIKMQKEFISRMIQEKLWDIHPDEEDLEAARKLTGYDG